MCGEGRTHERERLSRLLSPCPYRGLGHVHTAAIEADTRISHQARNRKRWEEKKGKDSLHSKRPSNPLLSFPFHTRTHTHTHTTLLNTSSYTRNTLSLVQTHAWQVVVESRLLCPFLSFPFLSFPVLSVAYMHHPHTLHHTLYTPDTLFTFQTLL